MSKHLFVDHNSLQIGEVERHEWQELSHWGYIKKRVQFWKYRLHRTLGRPILMRRQPNDQL